MASPPLHQRFPNINDLGIYLYVGPTKTSFLNDATFTSFILSDARHMSHLRCVHLGRAPGVTIDSLNVLFEHCPALESLHLPSDGNWQDSTFRMMAALPRLANLSVYSVPCSDASLADLAKLTGLQTLSCQNVLNEHNEWNMLTVPSTLVKLPALTLKVANDGGDFGTVQYDTVARLPLLSRLAVGHVDHTIGKLAGCSSPSCIDCDVIDMTGGGMLHSACCVLLRGSVADVAPVARLHSSVPAHVSQLEISQFFTCGRRAARYDRRLGAVPYRADPL